MSTITQARKDIKFLVSLTRGLSAIDEELERVGGLEKIEREIQGRVDALKSEEAGIGARLAACEAECVTRRDAVNKTVAEAEMFVVKAHDAAAETRREAADEAGVIKAEALAWADEKRASLEKDLGEARKRLQEIDGQIVEAQSRRDALNAEADEAVALRDAATAELARLKTLFGK